MQLLKLNECLRFKIIQCKYSKEKNALYNIYNESLRQLLLFVKLIAFSNEDDAYNVRILHHN